MSAFSIYLLTVLPNLGTVAIFFSVVLLGMGVWLGALSGIFFMDGDPEHRDTKASKTLLSRAKWFTLSGVICVLLSAAIPSEKQMALIVAGTYLTNSEWSKLPDDVAQLLRKQLQSLSEETDGKDTI